MSEQDGIQENPADITTILLIKCATVFIPSELSFLRHIIIVLRLMIGLVLSFVETLFVAEELVKKMKIALLGATGRTGNWVISLGLLREIEVAAIVRDIKKVYKVDDLLQVEKVNIYDPDELSKSFKDCDAVISCLGTGPGFLGWTPTQFYTDTMKSIVTAMRKVGITRLVAMSSWCTKRTSESAWFIEWLMRPFFIGNILKNLSEMEDYLMSECDDIEFTVVRAPGLGRSVLSGKEIKVREGQAHPQTSYLIPRADVAQFLLDCAQNKTWIRKCVSIGI